MPRRRPWRGLERSWWRIGSHPPLLPHLIGGCHVKGSPAGQAVVGGCLATPLSPPCGQRTVEHVVDGDGPEEPSGFVAHWYGHQIVRGETLCDFLVGHRRRHAGLLLEAVIELHRRWL